MGEQTAERFPADGAVTTTEGTAVTALAQTAIQTDDEAIAATQDDAFPTA